MVITVHISHITHASTSKAHESCARKVWLTPRPSLSLLLPPLTCCTEEYPVSTSSHSALAVGVPLLSARSSSDLYPPGYTESSAWVIYESFRCNLVIMKSHLQVCRNTCISVGVISAVVPAAQFRRERA